jgi:hypothetical protein
MSGQHKLNASAGSRKGKSLAASAVQWRASTTYLPPPSIAPAGPVQWTASPSQDRPRGAGDIRRHALPLLRFGRG